MKLLDGKKIMVTGARGIGEAVMKECLLHGADVHCISPRSGISDELKSVAHEQGKKVTLHKGSVSDEEFVTKLFSNEDAFDGIVNNAGITKDALSIGLTKADWDSVIDINLTGSFLVSREGVRKMAKKKKVPTATLR